MKTLILAFLFLATPAHAIPFTDRDVVHHRDVVSTPRPVVVGSRTPVQDRALADRTVLPPPVTVVPPLVLDGAPPLVLPGDPGPWTAESPPLQPTPEPATLLLVGTTAAGLGLARWRQRRRSQDVP